MTKVNFTPDWNAVRALSQKNGTIGRAVLNAAEATAKRAQHFAPVDTGKLRGSIDVSQPKTTEGGVSVEVVANTKYAAAVHQGGRKGRRARPYLTDALRQLKVSDFHE